MKTVIKLIGEKFLLPNVGPKDLCQLIGFLEGARRVQHDSAYSKAQYPDKNYRREYAEVVADKNAEVEVIVLDESTLCPQEKWNVIKAEVENLENAPNGSPVPLPSVEPMSLARG